MSKLFQLSFIAVFLVFCSAALSAQAKEGYIVYEDKTDIHSQLPPDMEAMKDRIPQFRTKEKILYFEESQSLYAKIPKELATQEKQDFTERRRRRRGPRGGRGSSTVYIDLKENQLVKSEDLFGKKFLISGETTDKPWKITGKQKKVGDYLCQEAMYQDSTQNVIAWFTPMIPVSIGPGEFRGLPGAVLRVEIDEGLRILTATKIITETLAENTIVKPEEGEDIEQEAFNTLREEKMEEMKKERRGFRRGPR